MTAEYALRAIATLAQLSAGDALAAPQLARQSGVPQHYLSKIMRRCVEHGLAQALKGPGGGFRLARPRARIRVYDVLDAVDEAPVLNSCAFGRGKCSTVDPCALHPVFSQLNQAMWKWATETTLLAVSTGGDAGPAT